MRPSSTDSRLAELLDRPRLALAGYVVATLVFTYPLSMRPGTLIPLGSGDLWQNLWNFWWWKRALLERHVNPYWTDALFHPDGVSLAFHTNSSLNILATLPLSALFGFEFAYNTALLAGFALAGFGAYLLIRDVTGEPRAAFVGGAIYAFSPMHFEQSLDHLNLSSLQFVPLLLFFLRRLVRRGGTGNVVGAGLAFAANALVCWQFGVLAIPLCLAWVARERLASAGTRPDPALLRDLLAAGALATAATVLIAWPVFFEALGTGGPPAKHFQNKVADPAFWLIPSDHHPLVGFLTAPLYALFRSYTVTGFLCYLGFAPLGLAVAAAVSRRFGADGRTFWSVWVLVFLLLSLGKHPVLLGRVLEGVTFPHGWFEGVPFLRLFRTANRFGLFAMLGLAVLAGMSLAALFRDRRARLAWLLAGVIAFEYLWLPYPTQPAGHHPYLRQVRCDPRAPAVLTIPFAIRAPHSRALYDQTAHGCPIIGGYTSYVRPRALETIRNSLFLSRLAAKRPAAAHLDVAELQRLGVGTVIVRRDRSRSAYRKRLARAPRDYYARLAQIPAHGYPDQLLDATLKALRRELGEPAYQDHHLVAFRVPLEPGSRDPK